MAAEGPGLQLGQLGALATLPAALPGWRLFRAKHAMRLTAASPLLRSPPTPPAAEQTGQLSIPTLPANFRDTAAQLGYIQVDFP